jgi:hypothetical protein
MMLLKTLAGSDKWLRGHGKFKFKIFSKFLLRARPRKIIERGCLDDQSSPKNIDRAMRPYLVVLFILSIFLFASAAAFQVRFSTLRILSIDFLICCA